MAYRPAHRTTTRQVAAAYPWLASPGLGTAGTYIGTDVYGGGPYVYDPWVQYQRTITSPNFITIGAIGSGKSALLKTLLFRASVFGRLGIVVDIKGEYAPLAAALYGGVVVRVAPPSSTSRTAASTLNLLDPALSGEMKEEMLIAVAATVLRRSLNIEEIAIIREAVAHVEARITERPPVLEDVWGYLLEPTADLAKDLFTSLKGVKSAGRDVGLALRSLSRGAVAGMFDGQTSVVLDPLAPITVMDLSGVVGLDDDLLRIVMLLTSGWIQTVWARRDGHRRYVMLDEAHRMMREVALLRWLSVASKIARQYQTALGFSMHRYSDLISGGDDGSEAVKIAKGLLSDCETRICYRQSPDQLPLVREWAGLSDMEATMIGQLSPGEAIWRVGSLAHRVRHRRSEFERRLTDTDQGQAGVDDALDWVRDTVAARDGGSEHAEPHVSQETEPSLVSRPA